MLNKEKIGLKLQLFINKIKEKDKIPILKCLNSTYSFLNPSSFILNKNMTNIISNYVCVDNLKHNDKKICIPIVKNLLNEIDILLPANNDQRVGILLNICDYLVNNLYFLWSHINFYCHILEKLYDANEKNFIDDYTYQHYLDIFDPF